MKKLIFALSAFALTSSPAFAFVLNGWERPIEQAQMTIIDQNGNAPSGLENAKTIELVMTQQDGAAAPTGFVLLIDGQSDQVYHVASMAKDACGSVTYTLTVAEKTDTSLRLNNAFETISVTDHAQSGCMDSLQYQWELHIANTAIFSQSGPETSQIDLAGNPERLMLN